MNRSVLPYESSMLMLAPVAVSLVLMTDKFGQ